MLFRLTPRIGLTSFAAGCALLALVVPGRAAEPTPLYLQSSASVDARVEDLLARMSVREKIAQMSGRSIPSPKPAKPTDPVFSTEWLEQNFADGVGTLSPCHLGIDEEIATRNAVQAFLRSRTRLGIPAFFHDEACHGLMKPEATSFPAPIGLACSWDEALIERLFDLAAREARGRGTHHVLTPVVDVTLDPRWGRTDETLGEDPFLNGRLGTAMIRGLQGGVTGEIDDAHVMATLKHLAGHGAAEGGLNRSAVHAGPIELRETHLAPFAAIIRAAKPAAIMPCYNEIDGIPAHANRALLRDVVRGELGFAGLLVSDYDGIELLRNGHRVAATRAEAARLALDAGLQMELPSPDTFRDLEPLLAQDPALATLVDNAVRAVLRWKFQLGLFEAAPLDSAAAHARVRSPAARELALQAARASIVLLKNDGLLPLGSGAHRTIAVIGPNADVTRLGGYAGEPLQTVSLLDGIRTRAGAGVEVLHAEGCKLASHDAHHAYRNWKEIVDVAPADPVEDRRLIAEARAVAERADLVILALGENEVVSRESWNVRKLGDRASLDLIGAQTDLAREILALGKPVVLYLANGRPIALGDLADRFPAILEGWYAGQETGRAAAEILFGDVNPSGKLTISIPRSVGHLPAHYRRKPYTGAYTYLFTNHDAQFPFGFGLSYTRFTYSAPRVSRAAIDRGERVQISVDLTNTGARVGTEIAQLYLRDEVSSVTRPMKELRGFQRMTMQPGETRTVTFDLGPDDLAFYNRDLRRVIEPGWFTVMVGGSSAETQSVRFEVK